MNSDKPGEGGGCGGRGVGIDDFVGDFLDLEVGLSVEVGSVYAAISILEGRPGIANLRVANETCQLKCNRPIIVICKRCLHVHNLSTQLK